MSHLGDFHPLETTTPCGSGAQSPIDRTMSMSPSSSTSTAELVSTSAPVSIPVPQKQEHLAIHEMDDMSMSINPVSDEFDNSTIFGSFAMTQSLRSNPESTLEPPRTFQRAISTNARMEHTQKGAGDDDGQELDPSPSAMVEDPFFPFLNPDLGGDMVVSSTTEMSNNSISASLMADVNKVATQNNNGQTKKKRWMITKGLSEADIGPPHHHHHHHHHRNHHGGRIMSSAASSNEVQPFYRPGIPTSEGSRPTATRHLGRQNSRGTRRKSSITSNLSFVGNYVFGSSVFQSPARSNASMASEKVNIVTDSLGIYPSMISLTSTEVALAPFEDELTLPLSTSHPRSFSASSSRQNSRQDLQQEGRKGHTRSISVTSRGSSVSLFTRPSGKEAEDRTSLRDEEEAMDKLTEVKPVVGRAIPPKKQWQQTMPDLVEGPESDTLTIQSTVRKNLAAAARVIAKVDEKKPLGEKGEDSQESDGEQLSPIKEIKPQAYKKNLYVLCTVFFFAFAAYLSLRNLQSSLNDTGGLGMYSLSCIYAFLCLGSLLTTTIVQRLRPKLSMLVGLCGILVYNSCNFYATYFTLIPGSCIAGFSLAILWTSQATYMANNAASYATATGQRFQDCLSHFHGIFFASFQFSQMVGGAISSLIFSLQSKTGVEREVLVPQVSLQLTNDTSDGMDNSTHLTAPLTSVVVNTTSWLMDLAEDYIRDNSQIPFQSIDANLSVNGSLVWTNQSVLSCGINNCPGQAISREKVEIDLSFFYIMVAVFVLSTVLSICILLFFLDPLEGSMKNPRAGIATQLSSVFRMLVNPHVLCLLPFMGYTLLQATFVFGEFNKAFVTCYLGIHMIGFMTVCLSIFSSCFAYLTGHVQKYIGMEVMIVTGLLLHLSVMTSLWIWEPSRDQVYFFFIAVAIWGAGDGMLTTLIISLLGILFVDKKEAVFSTYKMTQAASAFLLFVTGPYLCTRTKVIVLMVIATFAIIGYTILRLRLYLAMDKVTKISSQTINVNVPNKC